jgi:BASS family bile acid:Na+ symporter
MQESVLSNVALPVAIVIIMIALGMTLTVADFRRVLTEPKQVSIGLLCQLVLLPLLGFAVAAIFPLTPVFAISVILLAASPGGATSNLIVHAADGDRALSVTLTAISNMLTWLTIPLLLGAAYAVFGDGAVAIEFPIATVMVQVAGLTIVPVLLGMGVRKWRPAFAENSKRFTRIFASLFLFLIILALVVQNWSTIVQDGPRFAPAFITLNLAALAVGYIVARIAGINQTQTATIAIETGLQNSTVAITVALTILGSNEMAIVPGLYAIWMLMTGFALAFWLTSSARQVQVAP